MVAYVVFIREKLRDRVEYERYREKAGLPPLGVP